LVILGSGSTAFAAALSAAEMGKTVMMTEALKIAAIFRRKDPAKLSCCAS
jgi:hypothetical protein